MKNDRLTELIKAALKGPVKEDGDWIQKAIKPKDKDKLRDKLGIKSGKKIPKSLINKTIKKLKKKDKDDEEEGTQLGAADERELRQLNLAKTLSKFNENKLAESIFKKLRENKLLKEEQMGSYRKFLKVVKSYEDEEMLKDFLDSYPKGEDISKSEYEKFTEKHFGSADPEDYRDKNWKYIMSENKLAETILKKLREGNVNELFGFGGSKELTKEERFILKQVIYQIERVLGYPINKEKEYTGDEIFNMRQEIKKLSGPGKGSEIKGKLDKNKHKAPVTMLKDYEYFIDDWLAANTKNHTSAFRSGNIATKSGLTKRGV